MKETCTYLKTAIKHSKEVDLTKKCLLRSLRKIIGLKAAKGKCEKCKLHVNVGIFTGPSVESLTDIKETEN